MLQCYNRGCGQTYDPNNNNDDSCCHHPGAPYFHDAYKGWSCCKKKSVDFTEFLNFKGCTRSKHSNVKPPEPEKSKDNVDVPPPAKEIRPPIKTEVMGRPDFNTPLTKINATVAPALKQAIDNLKAKTTGKDDGSSLKPGEIPVGTACKNRGCKYSYVDESSDYDECQYHPGVPIFHEGLKFWSCCQKKTTDFGTFMAQPGCAYGSHKWFKDDEEKVVQCRYDWHQTPSNVIVAIYAKMYHYELSSVQVNPIRLKVHLVFPEQDDSEFNLDLELRGIIKVDQTQVQMYGTKIEITMPKAEACSWAKLDFPRTKDVPKPKPDGKIVKNQQAADSSDSEFDLDDIENVSTGVRLTDIS
ncbi:cysteine and histidine-rich domain-containing protein morgana [Episyrphus balteatus]|uniref:cysteine and histidine-rich domain-containing protein morgana n=1 Tax=Episyrphus balteatus TaxID=286459 RepID=UPI002485F2BA|nr:cysteine and histidine-rich domain-containing protein morgana [Episyrphus balteatus]